MDTTTTLKLAVSSTAPVFHDDNPNGPKNIERRHSLKIAERGEAGRLYKGSVLQHCGRPPGLCDLREIGAAARAKREVPEGESADTDE